MTEPSRLFPIAGDGWKFVLGFVLVGGLFLLAGPFIGRFVGVLFILAAVFAVYFFRDGQRTIPVTSDVLSPGDGRVLEVADVDGEGYGSGRVVRIFLSVLDGHVQRAPVAGKIVGTLTATDGNNDPLNLKGELIEHALGKPLFGTLRLKIGPGVHTPRLRLRHRLPDVSPLDAEQCHHRRQYGHQYGNHADQAIGSLFGLVHHIFNRILDVTHINSLLLNSRPQTSKRTQFNASRR